MHYDKLKLYSTPIMNTDDIKTLVHRVLSVIPTIHETRTLVSNYDLSDCYFTLRSKTNFIVQSISRITFWLCLYNNRSPYDNNINEELVNDILHQINMNEMSLDDLNHLCNRNFSTRINLENPNDVIPFLASILTSLRQTNIEEIVSELTFIKNNMNSFYIMCKFYHLAMSKHNLDIGNFMMNDFGKINNNVHTKIKPQLTFTTEHTQKHYIVELLFTPHTISTKHIEKINAKLHLATRMTHLNYSDERKLIVILPFQNQYIKFYHDPLISQLDLNI